VTGRRFVLWSIVYAELRGAPQVSPVKSDPECGAFRERRAAAFDEAESFQELISFVNGERRTDAIFKPIGGRHSNQVGNALSTQGGQPLPL
jgi:hypothetical protein